MWIAVDPKFGPYEVNAVGDIRRSDTHRPKRPTMSRFGYHVIGLWRDNRQSLLYVHALVAEAFIGARPDGLCVNHKDGNKTNNQWQNLEYITRGENIVHGVGLKLHPFGQRNGHSKLTNAQAVDIRRRALAGESTKALADEFGVGQPIVSQIKHGTRWRHLN